MSLIVTMQNRHGIVFCGDSRSTYRAGTYGVSEERDRRTKKIFLAKNFILGTFGRNKVFRDGSVCFIETVVEDLIIQFPDMSPQDFLKRMQDKLDKSLSMDKTPFDFLLGFRLAEGYEVDHCKVTAMENVVEPHYGETMWAYGYLDMYPRNIAVNVNWDVHKMEEAARLLVGSVITLGDKFLTYNPVGGKIQSEKFI